jgi:hypothetical protein
MAEAVYVLCAVTSAVCAILLLRSWRSSRTHLLLWTSLCFIGLAVNNILLVIDLVVLPATIDLSPLRSSTAAVAGAILLVGLIWEAR